MQVPKVPGGVEMGVSGSGDIQESRPWSLVKWFVLLPLGIIATAFFVPFLFTEILWLGLIASFLWLIFKTWRR